MQQNSILQELDSSELPPEQWSYNEIGKIFLCLNCLSIWLSGGYVLFFEKEERLQKLLAISAIAILIEKKV